MILLNSHEFSYEEGNGVASDPGGGYFGSKKANEPVHIAYDYATKKVFVVNSTLAARSALTATATLYNIPDLAQKYTTSVPFTAAANSSTSSSRSPSTPTT